MKLVIQTSTKIVRLVKTSVEMVNTVRVQGKAVVGCLHIKASFISYRSIFRKGKEKHVLY